MKLVRALLVLLTLAVAYLAQYLLDQRTFTSLLPDWLLQTVPLQTNVTRFSTDKVLEIGLWMLAGAGVVFGFIAPLWDGELDRRHVWRGHTQLRSKYFAAAIPMLVLCSIGLTCTAAYVSTLRATASLWWVGLWLAALLVLLFAGWLLGRQVQADNSHNEILELGRPERGWPIVIVLLCLMGGLLGFRWTEIPVRIDPMTTLAGLAGQGLVDGFSLLGESGLSVSALAFLPTALALLLFGDGLAAVHGIGLISALLTLAGTWLLGCELFRRVPRYGPYGETVVDDGRWMALLATSVAGFSIVALHFGRMPVYFEGTALGVWSLWLLIRGTRTAHFVLIGLAGVLASLAIYVHVIALLFIVVSLLWWGGVTLFVRRSPGAAVTESVSTEVEPSSDEDRPGKSTEFVYWAGAVAVTGSLLAGLFVSDSGAISRYWRVEYFLVGDIASLLGPGFLEAAANLPAKLRETLLTFNLYPDASIAFGYDAPLLHFWLSPLFVLAVGVTIVNVDSLIGWLLAGWLGTGLIAASLLAPAAPYWPLLVPVLPAVALATSLGIDRVRVLIVESIGSWSVQATMYLAVGAIVGAALFTWIGYYQFARLEIDQVSIVARAIRQGNTMQDGFLVSYDSNAEQVLSDPVSVFVASRQVESITPIVPGAWPGGIEDGAWFIVLPEDTFVLAELSDQYPQGRLYVERNLRGDPLYYVYEVPGADSF